MTRAEAEGENAQAELVLDPDGANELATTVEARLCAARFN